MTVTLRPMRTAPSHRRRAAALPQRRHWPIATAATMALLQIILLCRRSRPQGLPSMRIGVATRTSFVPSELSPPLLGGSRRSRGSFLRLPLPHLHPLRLTTRPRLLLLCLRLWEASSNCFALPSPSKLLLREPPLRLPPRLRKGRKPASLPSLRPHRLMLTMKKKRRRLLHTPWHRR